MSENQCNIKIEHPKSVDIFENVGLGFHKDAVVGTFYIQLYLISATKFSPHFWKSNHKTYAALKYVKIFNIYFCKRTEVQIGAASSTSDSVYYAHFESPLHKQNNFITFTDHSERQEWETIQVLHPHEESVSGTLTV